MPCARTGDNSRMPLRPIVLALFAFLLVAQDFSRELPGVLIDVRNPPTAVRCDGRYLLQYELAVTNAQSTSLTIQRVDVLGPGPLMTLEGESLEKVFASGNDVKSVVPGGRISALLLSVFTDRAPESLTHRIRVQVGGNSDPLTVEQPGTPVRRNVLRIAPPLTGTRWVVANGPAGNNHHTGGFMPYQGRVHVPQRFAIDFAQL
jgi:hypothetical protein